MQIKPTKAQGHKPLQALILFLSQTDPKAGKVKLTGLTGELKSWIEAAARKDKELAKAGTATLFRNAELQGHESVLIVGLGDSKKADDEAHRSAAAKAIKTLAAERINTACLLTANLDLKDAYRLQAIAEGCYLADYKLEAFKSKPKDASAASAKKEFQLNVLFEAAPKKSDTNALDAAKVISECVNLARRLGDTPGNFMTPDKLAKETQAAAKGTNLKVTVWDKARIKKERFGGLLGVSLGSGVDPRFIIMEYKGAGASKKPIAFVGKGLTFDSGGISIKPSSNMDEMRYDMQGGASVIATMLAIARLKLKVNALGFVPSSENMPGPLANKPGDIYTARNGKTVEVLNTDAEGRLILSDALSYASEKKPATIVEASTLTGAMLVALGNVHTGYFTKHDGLSDKIKKSAAKSGELVWPMPIHEAHTKDMQGQFADLSNISSGRGAGSSTAAAFLSEFVPEGIPFAHFDIAGTAWNCGNRLTHAPTKGATGAIVRTFIELAQNY